MFHLQVATERKNAPIKSIQVYSNLQNRCLQRFIRSLYYLVYDEVTLPESPDVHDNPAYANPGRMRLEENPAYVSTHQQ